MPRIRAKELKVYSVGGRRFIYVPNGRGEELRLRLESQGILSVLSRIPGLGSERLELVSDADAEAIQGLLDRWRKEPV